MTAPTIRNRRAFAAGLLFLGIATLFFLLSADLDRGSAARMGPGYFPTALSLVLGAVGLGVAAGALGRAVPAPAVAPAPWNWHALGWIVGSVVLFAVLLAPAGLVVALTAMVFAAARAGGGFTWRGTLVMAAVLAAVTIVVFDGVADLRLPLWPAWPD